MLGLGAATLAGGVAAVAVGWVLGLPGLIDDSGETATSPGQDATATATPESQEEPGDLLIPFRGATSKPQPRQAPTVQLSVPAPPHSPFKSRALDSREVVLYDIERQTERELGEGGYARFSPGGTWLAWIEFINPPSVMQGNLRVLELATGEVRVVGPARSLRWLDDRRVISHVQGNEMAIIDVITGEYGDPGSLNLNPPPLTSEAAGVRLDDVSPEVRGAPPWRRLYRITYLDGSRPPVEFEAYRARLSPDGMLVFALAPPAAKADLPWGTTVEGNIYLANPRTLEADYIATGLLSYGNWPLDVSEHQVFWTDNFCSVGGKARARILSRESRDLIELDAGFWAEFTPGGALAVGAFGAKKLLDTDRFEYVVALPYESKDVSWSPNYRYAAVGFTSGHGGLC